MHYKDRLYFTNADGSKSEEYLEGTMTHMDLPGVTFQSSINVVRFIPMTRVYLIEFDIARNVQDPQPRKPAPTQQ